MNSDLEEIKSRLDIVELISEYLPLKRGGQNYKGLCPFHPEKTPSFMVSPQKQIFHCFGCGAGGDVFGFVMKQEGLEFREAVEMLAKRAGVEIKRTRGAGTGLKDELRAVQAEALRFFSEKLSGDPRAKKYLAGRGVSGQSVKDFSLGYAPDLWHALEERLKAKEFRRERIMQSGLVAQGAKGPYDVFRDRIMFPIFDARREAIAFGGRALGDGQPKYLNSSDSPLFRKGDNLFALERAREGIRDNGFAVVVEGYLDAIMCHQHGITNTVAPLGTALTASQVKRLSRLSDDVMLVFDGDSAGTGAARRSLPIILAENVRPRVLLLPEGEDPDSLLRAEGPAHMRALMDSAFSAVEFVLKTSGGHGAAGEALELISKSGDPVTRDQMVLELSEKTRISEKSLREKLATYLKTGTLGPRPAHGRPLDEETLLLSVAASLPEKAGAILEKVPLDEIRNPLIRGLLEKLGTGGKRPEHIMRDGCTDEERALLGRLAMNPGFDLPEADRIIEDCALHIARKRMDTEIRSAEMSGDIELLNRLLGKRRRLAHGA